MHVQRFGTLDMNMSENMINEVGDYVCQLGVGPSIVSPRRWQGGYNGAQNLDSVTYCHAHEWWEIGVELISGHCGVALLSRL